MLFSQNNILVTAKDFVYHQETEYKIMFISSFISPLKMLMFVF